MTDPQLIGLFAGLALAFILGIVVGVQWRPRPPFSLETSVNYVMGQLAGQPKGTGIIVKTNNLIEAYTVPKTIDGQNLAQYIKYAQFRQQVQEAEDGPATYAGEIIRTGAARS